MNRLIVFSDSHVDGVSMVYDRTEYERRIDAAIQSIRKDGGLLAILGDDFDIKNSLMPEQTAAFKQTIKLKLSQSGIAYIWLDGNHDATDRDNFCECCVTTIEGKQILFHHGFTAKYGTMKFCKYGCGKFLRFFKKIGVWYRNIFTWKLKDKSKKYLSEYRKQKCASANITISGHEHPKAVCQFLDATCHYYVVPQGETTIYY